MGAAIPASSILPQTFTADVVLATHRYKQFALDAAGDAQLMHPPATPSPPVSVI